MEREENIKIWKAVLIISIIRIFDVGLTWIALSKWGIEREVNILLVKVISSIGNIELGLILYFLVTSIFLYFLLVLVFRIGDKFKHKFEYIFELFWIGLAAMLVLTVIWNFIIVVVL